MRTMLTVLAAAAFLTMNQAAFAQRDAASKIDGAAYEAPYFYNTTRMYQENAWGHAQVLQYAGETGEAVPPAIVSEHTTAIRSNLKSAADHHAKLRAAVKNNPAAARHLDALGAHHKQATALVGEIEAAAGDPAKVHKSSKALVAELKAAHETHKKLAEPLTSKKPAGK